MAYSLDALQDGCYENTTVLINKFDIRDEKTLNALEQEITGGLLARAITDIPLEEYGTRIFTSLAQRSYLKDCPEDLFMIATIKSASGDVFMLKKIFRTHITSL